MELTEDYIVEKLVKGDRKIFDLVYTSYVNDLYAYGKGFEVSDDELQDVLQDLFVSLWLNPHVFIGVKSVKAYLLTCFKNRLLNVLKTPREYCDISQYEHLFVVKVDLLDEIIDREQIEIREQKVQSLLKTLTNRQREAVYLRYMQKLSYEEVAEILSLTQKGARKLVARAIENMRENTETEYRKVCFQI